MLAQGDNLGSATLRQIGGFGCGKYVMRALNSRGPLHAEMQKLIAGRALEMDASAGDRLGNNVVNERAALRHSVDPSVRQEGKRLTRSDSEQRRFALNPLLGIKTLSRGVAA